MGYNGAGAAIHTDIGTSSTVNGEVANAFASQFEGTLLLGGGDCQSQRDKTWL